MRQIIYIIILYTCKGTIYDNFKSSYVEDFYHLQYLISLYLLEKRMYKFIPLYIVEQSNETMNLKNDLICMY